METTTVKQKTGKGFAISGFIISLISLVLWIFISGAAILAAALGGGMGLASFWLIFSLAGLGLSIFGVIKARRVASKTGLAITGSVIGMIGVYLSITTVMAVYNTQDEFEKAGLGTQTIETLNEKLH